jgi:hypothetical protein
MNANKISKLLLASASIVMLAACGGNSTSSVAATTRADATAALDAMATAITGKTGYTAPTKVTVTGSAANYTYSGTYAYKKYVTEKAATSTASAISASSEFYAYISGSDGYVASSVGTTKTYFKTTAVAVTAIAAAKVAAAVKSMEGSPAYISSYLKKFDNLTNKSDYSGVSVGGTTKETAMGIKDESYAIAKTGSLVAKWTSVYAKETPADEPLEYTYVDNMLTHTYNGKSKALVDYKWNVAAETAPTLTGYTEETDAIKGAALVLVVTAAL